MNHDPDPKISGSGKRTIRVDAGQSRTGSNLFETGIRRITGTSLLVRVTNNLEEGAEHISRGMIVKVICFQHPEETKWNNVNSKIIL